jgi:hypothetical protein
MNEIYTTARDFQVGDEKCLCFTWFFTRSPTDSIQIVSNILISFDTVGAKYKFIEH